MARYQMILAYDGTDFVGSQRQANPRTVQGELEKALRKLGWSGNSVLMAGRTDTGVHAAGQVAAFDLEWAHSPEDLRNALNANLPLDMATREVRLAPEKFHPRFDASFRRYRYRLLCAPTRNPLRERFAWRVWPAVKVAELAPLAQIFIGTHDFAAFGSPPRSHASTVRTVFLAGWRQVEDECWFEVQADAFLYHMVRRLVGTQVKVGQGKLPAGSLSQALAGRAKIPIGLAPANGLTLMEVGYSSLADESSGQN
jgi:tRNA pseudouridine38-40 synthase